MNQVCLGHWESVLIGVPCICTYIPDSCSEQTVTAYMTQVVLLLSNVLIVASICNVLFIVYSESVNYIV